MLWNLSVNMLIIKKIIALIPKQDNLWVLGSSSGYRYNDNSKYLYEYLHEKSDIKAVWLTKSREILTKLRNEGKVAYHFYSLQGIWIALRARYITISYSYDDVSFFCYLNNLDAVIVQLYHGTPLKRLETINHWPVFKLFAKRCLLAFLGRQYDYVFCASDSGAEALNQFFKIDKKHFKVSGFPRNDVLFRNKQIATDKKCILYMPTFREYSQGSPNFNLFSNFNQANLEEVLKTHNAHLFIKLHPNDYSRSGEILGKIKENDYIHFLFGIDDIYPFLSGVDILITDYSSIYFDFLLLDRPIIFAPFDLEEYTMHDRGFYFNYEQVTPGYKVHDWLDLTKKLDAICKGEDSYKNDRARVNNIFNQYRDGNSSSRIVEFLESL